MRLNRGTFIDEKARSSSDHPIRICLRRGAVDMQECSAGTNSTQINTIRPCAYLDF